MLCLMMLHSDCNVPMPVQLSLILAVQWDAIFRSNSVNKFTVCSNMNPNIGLLRLFPGITSETVSNDSNHGIPINNLWCSNIHMYIFHTHAHKYWIDECLFYFISLPQVQAFLKPPMLGVVLQTYGCGNAPNNREDIISEIKKATRRGVLIVNCTQCLHGPVVDQYATGKVRN